MIDLTAIGLALSLGAAAYWIGIEPILADQRYHERQRITMLELEEQARDKEQDLRALRGHYVRAQQTLDQQALRLEPLHVLNRRLNDIASLGRQMRLELEQIRPHDAEDHQYFHQLPIDLQGRGTFMDATAFLHQLKHQVPDVGVRSFELAGDPRQPAEGMSFRIELIWYAAPAAHAER